MECEFCGHEPHDPLTLRPVRAVNHETDTLEDKEYAACEDCWLEVSEPERQWRLKHECPICWAHPCACETANVEAAA